MRGGVVRSGRAKAWHGGQRTHPPHTQLAARRARAHESTAALRPTAALESTLRSCTSLASSAEGAPPARTAVDSSFLPLALSLHGVMVLGMTAQISDTTKTPHPFSVFSADGERSSLELEVAVTHVRHNRQNPYPGTTWVPQAPVLDTLYRTAPPVLDH